MRILPVLFLLSGALLQTSAAQSFEPFHIENKSINSADLIGTSVTDIGDVDDNGITDLIVGAPGLVDPDGSNDTATTTGALFVIRRTTETKILDVTRHLVSDFCGCSTLDSLGLRLQAVGDIDGDGSSDILVQGTDAVTGGRLHYHFSVDPAGRAVNVTPLFEGDSVQGIGDVNNDGFRDVMTVAARHIGSGDALQPGEVAIYPGGPDGLMSKKVITPVADYSASPLFGKAIENIGDLDGDNVSELVVSDSSGFWVIFLTTDFSIKQATRVSPESLGLDAQRDFGSILSAIDRTGTLPRLMLAVPSLGLVRGSLLLLDFETNGGAVLSDRIWQKDFPFHSRFNVDARLHLSVFKTKAADGMADFWMSSPFVNRVDPVSLSILPPGPAIHLLRWQQNTGLAEVADLGQLKEFRTQSELNFPSPLWPIGDLDGNGFPEAISGLGIHFLNETASIISTVQFPSHPTDTWGAFYDIGDFDGDGLDDLSAYQFGQSLFDILLSTSNGTFRHLNRVEGRVNGSPLYPFTWDSNDGFGRGVVPMGDFDGDGVPDLVTTTSGPYGGQPDFSVFMLFMNGDGSLKRFERSTYDDPRQLGGAVDFRVVNAGDIDGDGIADLAGTIQFQQGGSTLYTITMHANGTIKNVEIISSNIFPETFGLGSNLTQLTAIGDLDQNGVNDILLGPDLSARTQGLFIVLLQPDGTASEVLEVTPEVRPTGNVLSGASTVGGNPAVLWDMNNDGFKEVLVDFVDASAGIHRPLVLSLPDLLKTRIDATRIDPEKPESGTSLNVHARIRSMGIGSIHSARVRFRRAGPGPFFSVPLEVDSTGYYSANVPGYVVDETGFEYYYEAVSTHHGLSRYPETGFYSAPVSFSSGPTSIVLKGSDENGYRLLSVPLELDAPEIKPLLESMLGEYNPKEWRFFHTSTPDPHELDNSYARFEPGKAYWMISNSTAIIDWGPGTSVATDSIIALPLSVSSRWTFLGSPFNFEVPFDQLALASGEPLDIRQYHGQWQVTDSILVPFEGYAVYSGDSNRQDSLLIAPSPEIAILSGRFQEQLSKKEGVAEWTIPIHVSKGRARDRDNRAILGAADLNRADPPPVGNHVQLAFEGPQHPLSTSTPQQRGEDYLTWDFFISSASAGTAHLVFPDLTEVPEDASVQLIDKATGWKQDLRNEPDYDLALAGNGQKRLFTLWVGFGTPRQEQTPLDWKLHEAFPNPFTGSTTFAFETPDPSDARIDIFNVLGQHVAMLEHRQRHAGKHVLTWDGRSNEGISVAPGLYVARLTAGDFRESITLIRIR